MRGDARVAWVQKSSVSRWSARLAVRVRAERPGCVRFASGQDDAHNARSAGSELPRWSAVSTRATIRSILRAGSDSQIHPHIDDAAAGPQSEFSPGLRAIVVPNLHYLAGRNATKRLQVAIGMAIDEYVAPPVRAQTCDRVVRRSHIGVSPKDLRAGEEVCLSRHGSTRRCGRSTGGTAQSCCQRELERAA